MRYFYIVSYILGTCSLAACGCVNVTFQTTLEAYNNIVNINGDTSLDTTVQGFLQNITDGATAFSTDTQYINGSYDITGRLCEPSTIVDGLPQVVQLLVHGIGYNRAYWSGLNPAFTSSNGSSYSWVEYARSQGYYTLAIDRLGNGRSSRPDPINVLQIPLEVEVLHSIINQLREVTSFSPSFKHVVYVGHSYGSALGNHLAAAYPDDADDYVLTGWSSLEPVLKGTPSLSSPQPAARVDNVFS